MARLTAAMKFTIIIIVLRSTFMNIITTLPEKKAIFVLNVNTQALMHYHMNGVLVSLRWLKAQIFHFLVQSHPWLPYVSEYIAVVAILHYALGISNLALYLPWLGDGRQITRSHHHCPAETKAKTPHCIHIYELEMTQAVAYHFSLEVYKSVNWTHRYSFSETSFFATLT